MTQLLKKHARIHTLTPTQVPPLLNKTGVVQAKQSAAEVQDLQQCFQEAQARAEAAQQQNRQLLAANAQLQAAAEESYVKGQASAAQIADLQARSPCGLA